MRPAGQSRQRGVYLRDGLAEFALTLPPDCVMAEVGSFFGESAEIFLESGRVRFVHLVDPFDFSVDDAGGFGPKFGPEAVRSELLRRVVRNPRYDLRVKLHERPSVEAASQFEDGVLDAVYIDGCHRYDFVVADIRAWRPKVRPGGVIAGHDWHLADVQRAVREELGEPEALFSDTTWSRTNR